MIRKSNEKELTVSRKFVGTQKLEDVLFPFIEYQLDKYVNKITEQDENNKENQDGKLLKRD